MKHGLKLGMALAMLVITSACERPEPPRTVSDLCLNSQRISAEPAPEEGADDFGNQWDTDKTFSLVLEHNEVMDRLCASKGNK